MTRCKCGHEITWRDFIRGYCRACGLYVTDPPTSMPGRDQDGGELHRDSNGAVQRRVLLA